MKNPLKPKTIWIVGLFIAAGLFAVNSAYAVNEQYHGGSYDGYSASKGANMDVATISSAADQTFDKGDSATAISTITIVFEAGQAGGGINTADGIRVIIPTPLNMAWDTSDLTATIGGSASAKVSATVSYPDNKTLLIDVLTNFANDDSITVSDLSFESFNSGRDNLELSVDGGSTTAATDSKEKRIRPDQYTGGSYDGYDSSGGSAKAKLSDVIRIIWDNSATTGDANTDTISGVTVDLSALGGSGTQTMFDDATNGDATSGDNIWTYDYTVTSGSTEGGNLTISVTSTDNSGNTTTATNSFYISLDSTAPTLTTVSIASNNATTTLAKVGDTVTLTIVASENIGTPTVSIDGNSADAVSQGADAQHWTATRVMQSGDTEGAIAFSIGFSDLAGNAGSSVTATTDSSSVTFDKSAPTFAIQYYSDSDLATSLGDNPKLEVGTYYLKITANETLSAAPTISIAAEGTANDVSTANTVLVSGNDYKYTRTISNDAAALGLVLEDISISGTDLLGHTATNANPTNEATKAGYTNTVELTFSVAGTSVDKAGDTIALTFNKTMAISTIANGCSTLTIQYADDGSGLNAATLTTTNATVSWNSPTNTIATITLNEATDATFIPNNKYIRVRPNTGEVTDLVGNAVASSYVYTSSSITAETTVPTISVTVESKNNESDTITITSDEVLSRTAAETIANWLVQYDSDAVAGDETTIITANAVISLDDTGKIVLITLDESVDGAYLPEAKYVKISPTTNIKDLAGNSGVEADYSAQISGETTVPTFSVAATSVHSGGDTIVLTFSEPMDVSTITAGCANLTISRVDNTIGGGRVNLTTTNSTVSWNTARTIATITLNEETDSAYIPDGKYVEVVASAGAVKDLIGNVVSTLEKYTVGTVSKETTSPAFTDTAPAASSSIENEAKVSYTLSETCASGTITWTRTGGSADGSSPHSYTLSGSQLHEGSQSDLTLSGITLADGAVYTVQFEATDLVENTGSTENTNVSFTNPAPVISSTAPAAGTATSYNYVQNTKVSYTLSETAASGTITWTRTGGALDTNHAQALTGSELEAGAHTNITLSNDPTLVSGAIYTVKFEATDLAGRSATAVENAYVSYDPTAPTTTVAIAKSYYGPNTWDAVNTIIGTASDAGSGVASTELSIKREDGETDHYWNGVNWTSTTEQWLDVTSGTTSWKYTLAGTLTNGKEYTVRARATDNIGNTTSSGYGSDSWTYDSTAPTISDVYISITSTGSGLDGKYNTGDKLTVQWNNGSSGDNNSDIDLVTCDFSAFGGSSSVAMNAVGSVWTASYIITVDSPGGSKHNVSVTASDYAGNSATQADTSNVAVYYGVTWSVVSSVTGGNLGGLTVSETSRTVSGWSWSASGLRSPVKRKYPTGETFTTTWSKEGYEDATQENWTASADATIELEMSLTFTAGTLQDIDRATTSILADTTTLKSSVSSVKSETASIFRDTASILVDTGEKIPLSLATVEQKVGAQILNRETSVKKGDTITIRYRADSGLSPEIDVYDAGNVQRVTDGTMTEIGSSGVYEYDVKFLSGWGKGDYTVICSESTQGTVDSMTLSVLSTDIESISRDVSATLAMKDTSELEAKISALESKVAQILGRLTGKIGGGISVGIGKQVAEVVTKPIYAEIKTISRALEEIGTSKEYGLKPIYEVSEKSAEDVVYLKNKTLELKAVADVTRELVGRLNDKPIVRTWMEIK